MSCSRLDACAGDSIARTESGQPCLLLLCNVMGVDFIPFVTIFARGLWYRVFTQLMKDAQNINLLRTFRSYGHSRWSKTFFTSNESTIVGSFVVFAK